MSGGARKMVEGGRGAGRRAQREGGGKGGGARREACPEEKEESADAEDGRCTAAGENEAVRASLDVVHCSCHLGRQLAVDVPWHAGLGGRERHDLVWE